MRGGIGMNKKIFAMLIAMSLLMTGCQAAETTESSVPASEPSVAESVAETTAAPTPTPTATPTPAADVPSLEDMDFEDVVAYIMDGNLLTDDMVKEYTGDSESTVADYVDYCVDLADDRYFNTDANKEAGIEKIVEMNFYTYLEDEGYTDCVEVKVIEVDPDTVSEYEVGDVITIHFEAYLEYYDENDELVKEETVEDTDWPIAAISGNYILVAQEKVSSSEVTPASDVSEVDFTSTNVEAPYSNEQLQAVYDAFDALA